MDKKCSGLPVDNSEGITAGFCRVNCRKNYWLAIKLSVTHRPHFKEITPLPRLKRAGGTEPESIKPHWS
jgi:hypothetical protein